MSIFSRFGVPVVAAVLLVSCGGGSLHDPLDNARNRATPLSFGLYVTPDPATNPITPPERFTGYHAALDYEVSEGEVEGDVPVYAICTGRIVYSGYVEGYGGTVVQRCVIQSQDVTVIYGHLNLEGLPAEESRVRGGTVIALLGAPVSHDSGYNRKHLHLGIHKGRDLDFAGYVQTEEELQNYLNPVEVLPSFTVDLPTESPGEIPYWKAEELAEDAL